MAESPRAAPDSGDPGAARGLGHPFVIISEDSLVPLDGGRRGMFANAQVDAS